MNIRTRVFGATPSEESPLVCVKQPKGAKLNELLSISVQRSASGRGNTRLQEREPRFPEPACANWNGEPRDVRLLNLSDGGAMIEATFEPAMWDNVQLALNEECAADCTVVWMKDQRIGLEFANAR